MATGAHDDTSFRIGRYEIRGEIGRGTMGIVYEAYDPLLRRVIALKTFHLSFAVSPPQYESLKSRFFGEARIAARLSHSGIVAVHDVGSDPEIGTLFIALEYVQGRTLQAIMADGVPLGWPEVLRITRQVAEALHYAHSESVFHRDIKPANIMLLPSGNPKVLDFGIAKVESARFKMTTCQVFGTPLFMAPEQALGHKADGRADLFSLGSIAYTLLTGRLAFDAPSIPATVKRLIEDDPEPPSHLVPDLPRGLDEIIARALAKSPDRRYSSGQALAEDIDALLARLGGSKDEGRATRAEEEVSFVSSLPAVNDNGIPPIYTSLTSPEDPVFAPRPGLASLDVDAELAALVAGPAAVHDSVPAGGDRGARRTRQLFLTALLAVLSVSYLALRSPSPAAEAPAPPLSQTPAPAAPLPKPSSPARPVAVEPPAAVEAQAVKGAKPSTRAQSGPVAPAKRPEESLPVVQPARLRIGFEHPPANGTLRVWVGGQMAIQADLATPEAMNRPDAKPAKGRFEREVPVKPGEHPIRVEVHWDDNDRQQVDLHAFQSGSVSLVEINLGWLRKNLSLKWQ